ncbi:porin family protein [bacterium]|nr:porin family protein [candidate division CSSED10-310 bacterium]
MNREISKGLALLILVVMSMISGTVKGAELSADLMLQGVFPTGELDRRFDTTFGGSFALTYMYSPYVGVHSSMNHHSLSRDRDGSDFSVWYLDLNGVLAYPFLTDFRGYVLGGMGVYIWNTDRAWWTDYRSKDGANLGFNFGAGVNYLLKDDIGVSIEFKRHGIELSDRDSRVYWNDLSLGVRFILDSRVFEH